MATISTETHLREDLGSPSDLIVAKVTDHLTPLTRQFVERSPFVCVATSRPDGGLDLSPRRPGRVRPHPRRPRTARPEHLRRQGAEARPGGHHR
jgi:predicted pyridoxine 5'-phosphate oxidase superfamily flavin-nucleotide-binding protein